MCDCYFEPCKSCGKPINMHLGDYETHRSEIVVYCNDCLCHGIPYSTRKYFAFCVWKAKEHGRIAVVSLTKHAWKYRDLNYPNIRLTEGKGHWRKISEVNETYLSDQ